MRDSLGGDELRGPPRGANRGNSARPRVGENGEIRQVGGVDGDEGQEVVHAEEIQEEELDHGQRSTA